MLPVARRLRDTFAPIRTASALSLSSGDSRFTTGKFRVLCVEVAVRLALLCIGLLFWIPVIAGHRLTFGGREKRGDMAQN